jgi:hypothetical protein
MATVRIWLLFISTWQQQILDDNSTKIIHKYYEHINPTNNRMFIVRILAFISNELINCCICGDKFDLLYYKSLGVYWCKYCSSVQNDMTNQ